MKLLGVVNEVGGFRNWNFMPQSVSLRRGEKKRINVFRALNILNSHIFDWRALLRGLGACIALLARQKNKNSDKNNIPFIGPVARAGRRLIE